MLKFYLPLFALSITLAVASSDSEDDIFVNPLRCNDPERLMMLMREDLDQVGSSPIKKRPVVPVNSTALEYFSAPRLAQVEGVVELDEVANIFNIQLSFWQKVGSKILAPYIRNSGVNGLYNSAANALSVLNDLSFQLKDYPGYVSRFIDTLELIYNVVVFFGNYKQIPGEVRYHAMLTESILFRCYAIETVNNCVPDEAYVAAYAKCCTLFEKSNPPQPVNHRQNFTICLYALGKTFPANEKAANTKASRLYNLSRVVLNAKAILPEHDTPVYGLYDCYFYIYTQYVMMDLLKKELIAPGRWLNLFDVDNHLKYMNILAEIAVKKHAPYEQIRKDNDMRKAFDRSRSMAIILAKFHAEQPQVDQREGASILAAAQTLAVNCVPEVR